MRSLRFELLITHRCWTKLQIRCDRADSVRSARLLEGDRSLGVYRL